MGSGRFSLTGSSSSGENTNGSRGFVSLMAIRLTRLPDQVAEPFVAPFVSPLRLILQVRLQVDQPEPAPARAR
jgi:hypothetical protein